jgi:malate dehydrogenase (oxaloacetate-decarboxylating)(NADP+)
MDDEKRTFTDEEALAFHRWPTPGKLAVHATKPMATQRDLSLAYSPGVAVPVLAIAGDVDLAYDYTSKGNMVAVITNGTAILGLGDLGALAAKPVMEGKSVLFKRFADVDSIDIEVSSKDADEIITVVKNIGSTFGGINLEDIKSPECFRIETELQELLDIPCSTTTSTGRRSSRRRADQRLRDHRPPARGHQGGAERPGRGGHRHARADQGHGRAARERLAVDSKGVLWRGRTESMNQYKSAHAVETPHRTLAEAMVGATCSSAVGEGRADADMVRSMASRPIIFAMANPDPEITPEEVQRRPRRRHRRHGAERLPEPGQQRAGVPLHLPGRAGRAGAAREPRDEAGLRRGAGPPGARGRAGRGHGAYGRRLQFGPEYIIPTPFDPRLIWYIPPVRGGGRRAHRRGAQADRGHGRLPRRAGAARRSHRRLPAEDHRRGAGRARQAHRLRRGRGPVGDPRGYAFATQGLGRSILVGREELIVENMRAVGIDPAQSNCEFVNARVSDRNAEYAEALYGVCSGRGTCSGTCSG